eukprot:gene5580-6946_t
MRSALKTIENVVTNTNSLSRHLFIRNLGRVSYSKCLDIQKAMIGVDSTAGNNGGTIIPKNSLILVEHSSPVYTLGYFDTKEHDLSLGSKEMNHLGFEIHRVEKRESGITWHGPGQLTVYPMLFDYLSYLSKDSPHQYMESLGNVIKQSLKYFGIDSKIKRDSIYVGKDFTEKIGDVKLFSNLMLKPGFSININPNLSYYKHIVVPSNGKIKHNNNNNNNNKFVNNNLNVTSLWSQTQNNSITIGDVIPIVLDQFEKNFGLGLIDSNQLYQLRSQFVDNHNQTNFINIGEHSNLDPHIETNKIIQC